ncbi:MAG: DUF1952 domain-containing protein [Thermoflexales bacterium]|nr:DUF1952 domain-containing protein [Thermoflexales bacterium]
MFGDDLGPLDITVGSITPWLMGKYFRDLGAQEGEDGWFLGEGWRGRVDPAEPLILGSLRVGRVRIQVEGEAEALARLRPQLDLKLIRGGG